MTNYGWSIHYSDSRFAPPGKKSLEAAGRSRIAPGQILSKEDGQKVYCWRAQLVHAPSIWREVEILGRQSISELDSILRDAFHHDIFDHLSGFWKRIVRGGSSRKRYREVRIADVHPYESTADEDTTIAALKFNVGDQMKYVYDFGDWIEHILELQSIGEAESGVDYPREVARNKPKYEYCIECQEEGKKTIATWTCYTCSNEKQIDVFLCGNCMNKHGEHYTQEILY
jgi:hypothetical protein